MWYLWVTYQSAGDGSSSRSSAGAAPELSVTMAGLPMHGTLREEFVWVGFFKAINPRFVKGETLREGGSGRTVTVQPKACRLMKNSVFSLYSAGILVPKAPFKLC